MSEVTRILDQIQRGNSHAAAQLLPLVYDELRRLAGAQVAQERPDHTLDATALVHEAYLRLGGDLSFENRRHFLAAAAQSMKRILIENARSNGRQKRGGDREREDVDLDRLATGLPDEELLVLHDALERFAIHDAVKAQSVDLHFFGGLSLAESEQHQVQSR